MHRFARRELLVVRVTPWALGLQVFAVLAVPLAFCCCIAMATHHVAPEAMPADEQSSDSHHHPTAPIPSDGPEEPGCPHLDQLVMVISGLLGTTTAPTELVGSLPVVGVVNHPATRLVFVPSSVDVPPPRV